MVEAVVKNFVAHRERLGAMLQALKAEGPISLNLATFWASRRDGKAPGYGCLIGHYVMKKAPNHLALVPLNFLEQVKAPILADRLLASLPNTGWRHYTLHYHGPEVEAWGMSAACLYFQLNKWDVQTLFWPAGHDNKMLAESSLVLAKLERFLSAEKALHDDLR